MGYRVTYEETIFQNAANGYKVISYKTSDNNIPFEARNPKVYPDGMIRFPAIGYGMPQTDKVEVLLNGNWEINDKYGLQLVISNWKEIIPQTKEGVIGYLACGLIKGIGEKTASEIVGRFGINAISILDKNPEKLLDIKNITESKLETIKESYALSRPISGLMTFLAPYGITPYKTMKIQQKFGANSLSVIKASPFNLCKIPGFGFLTVDSIAVKTGCKPNDPLRIRGALSYVMDESCREEGHLCLQTEELCKRTLKLLNKRLRKPEFLALEEVYEELYNVVSDNELIYKYESIYLPVCYKSEGIVAKRVAELLIQPIHQSDISNNLKEVTQEIGIILSAEQEAGVKMVFNSNLSIITGPPGTGKTTVLKALLYSYRKINKTGNILLAAPTGRASRRMAESTGIKNAKTLHSALGLISGDDANSYLNKKEMINADLIVVDECSMIDLWLSLQFFTRIKNGTKVVMLGDPQQLPSVGAGNVFRELINCGYIPVTRLTEIYRQSSESSIPYNSKLINNGDTKLFLNTNDFIFQECEMPTDVPPLIHKIYLDEISRPGNVQILSPMKERGDSSAEKMNIAIQTLINPACEGKPEIKVGDMVFRQGDRVMQTKNKNNISNGDVGLIQTINDGKVIIDFSDNRIIEYDIQGMKTIELAYSITVHKAMGSEYDTVIMPVLLAHKIHLNRNMLYTGVTRAKKRIFLVGQRSALNMAIRTANTENRMTWLAHRISLYYRSFYEKEKAA